MTEKVDDYLPRWFIILREEQRKLHETEGNGLSSSRLGEKKGRV